MTNSPSLLETTRILTKTQAARELLRRREARTSLLAFTKYTFPDYLPEPAHALICQALDRVVKGEIDRLMIFAPPQHGKSELVSVRLPPFFLGRRPNDPIILSSYGSSLAISKSRHARAVIEDPVFGKLFPSVGTWETSRAVDEWELAPPHRGSLLASGVGGSITGYGAMLGIIDDPHKDWADAQSLNSRNSVWEWYLGTFLPRIREGGAVVIIMTRWHLDDLAGRLLRSQGKEWEILRLPAIAEDQKDRDQVAQRLGLDLGDPDPLGRKTGEPLCPSRFSLPTLHRIHHAVGTNVWNAEYQGNPVPMEGNRFKRGWFQIRSQSFSRSAKRIRYWDHGATEQGGSFTAGVLLSSEKGVYCIEDVVHGQWSTEERDRVKLQTMKRDRSKFGNVVWQITEQEPGSAGKDVAKYASKIFAGFLTKRDKVTGSKDVRIEPFAAQAEAGNVYLKEAPWNEDYINELTAIPNSKYRDQADASAGAFNHSVTRKEAGLEWL